MNLQHFLPGSGRAVARNIFISYRVQETAGEAGRLVDAAFMDPEVQKMVKAINGALPSDSARPGQPDNVPADKTAVDAEAYQGQEEKAAAPEQPQASGKQGGYQVREHAQVGEQPPVQIQGTWVDVTGNFLVFNQSRRSFTLKGFNIGGYCIGNGSGEVNEGEISFDFNYQVNYIIQYLTFKLTRPADGWYLNGTQTY